MPASIPSPPPEWQTPISIPLWPGTVINIHTYALCILVGIVIATWLTEVRLRKRGVEPWAVVDILIFAVPLGIVGARFWHVATHPTDYFPFDETRTLLDAIAIWDGGGAIFGALLGGALGAWIGCRIAGIRFLTFLDAVAPGLLFAQALGRLGNWFNHELFGLPTTLPWGLEISADNPAYPVGFPEGVLFHPTFLYEIIWNVIGAVAILLLERRLQLQWGKVFALYLIWYGIGRAWLEAIRLDPSEIVLGLRINDWGAIAAIVLGLVILVVQSRRHTGRESTPYRPGRGWREGGAVDSKETFSDADFASTAAK
ncbi:MAG: prolipoprotein diacylglyceryl transferase [Microbacteriaceae bacterium]|nr:prolipoprotein diacylglyceryl transferase [Microbacteriaceae bacterium]